MDAKRVSESRITLSQLMTQQDANLLGNVHGGVLMKLVDTTGALAALRHAQNPVVTVAIDSMTFQQPIAIGNVVTVKAELTYAGRTSMEVSVEVHAEHPMTGKTTHTNSAYVVYVALDGQGRPCEVPPLLLETEQEKARWKAAEQRQQYRKASRKQEEQTGHGG